MAWYLLKHGDNFTGLTSPLEGVLLPICVGSSKDMKTVEQFATSITQASYADKSGHKQRDIRRLKAAEMKFMRFRQELKVNG